MNKTILSTLLLLSFLLILTAFGAPQAEQGEINEISYGTFIKFLDDENSKPFFFIATDEKEDSFNQDIKPIYEDYLTEQGTGAFYLNLHKISDEKINELITNIDFSQKYDFIVAPKLFSELYEEMIVEMDKADYRTDLDTLIVNNTIKEDIKNDIDELSR